MIYLDGLLEEGSLGLLGLGLLSGLEESIVDGVGDGNSGDVDLLASGNDVRLVDASQRDTVDLVGA